MMINAHLQQLQTQVGKLQDDVAGFRTHLQRQRFLSELGSGFARVGAQIQSLRLEMSTATTPQENGVSLTEQDLHYAAALGLTAEDLKKYYG